MNAPPLVVRIGSIRVSGASATEARRLADALPAALEAALMPDARRPARMSPAERAAFTIADAVRARMEAKP